MDLEKIQKIEGSIKNLKNKGINFYFLTQDTKGNAKASVRFIYQIAKSLIDNGYNATIIHEKTEFSNVKEWLGSEYSTIPHKPIESQDLKISPEDFIVIPELYGYVLEQISNLSCGKILLCQSYDYVMETLPPGLSWSDYGFMKCITTSKFQKEYLETVMKNISYDIIEPLIPNDFSEKEYPSKPTIAIHTRDQRDTMKIIKTFYLKYPQYRWITFRDMRGLSQTEFSEILKTSFVSVWVDDISGFGTFPIESMSCKTPVIGKVPNLKPSWLNENNGIWTYELNNIPDIISEYIQNWLEDGINDELYDNLLETSLEYKDYEKFESSVISIFEHYISVRKDIFETQLEKIKIKEEL